MYFRQNGKLTYTLWRDSSVMSILSTAHQAFRNKLTDTLTQNFSMNGIEPRKEHPIPAPRQVIDYTSFMGGVDRADQLRSYHTCARKSQMWWKQLLYFIIDIARVNAWICYKHLSKIHEEEQPDEDQPRNSRHSQFVMDIAESLIGGYAKDNEPTRQYRQRQATQDVRAQNADVRHKLVRMPGWGKQCVDCQKHGRSRPAKPGQKARLITSRYGCEACDQRLCKYNKTADCFRSWHESN